VSDAPEERLAPAPGRPPPLRIGSLSVAPPVVLAPMSSLTNLPMRALCEEAGCGLTITEFIAAPALCGNVHREVRKLQPSPEGRPFGVQIFGRDPGQMGKAAGRAAAMGATIVDLNMGCPARKVTKGVAGCALMREPELAAELVRSACEQIAGRAPLTVKIRAGWDEQHKSAPEFAARMVEAGAAAVTVHGRTRMQGFSGVVDLEIIRRVKQAVTVPVIGNGDIVDVASLQRMFEATGCDGAMIGRAALGNPWLFAAARAWWTGGDPPAPPTSVDRLRMYRRHLELYLRIADEPQAVIEMRKFASWYLRGFARAAQLRKAVYGLTALAEVFRLVEEAERSEAPAST
jgi:tRNA-dihydrouridine synthase B